MRVLVTGGNGFVGSHLVAALAADGHHVSVLDDLSAGRRDLPGDTRLIEGDVRDPEAVRRAMDGAEAVFHLASVVGVPNAMHRQWDSLTTNIVGTLRILEGAELRSLPVLITSSSAIYGKTPRIPVEEGDDVLLGNTHVASWTYSYAKLAEELLARAAHVERGVGVKIVRLFNVTGPGQSGQYGMVLPRFVTCALRGGPLTVYGDGSHTRTFVDVRDAIRGMRMVWERGDWGEVYNVGGVGEISILDLAKRVVSVVGSSSPIRFMPYPDAFGTGFEETARRVPAIERVRSLGYRPEIGLDDTIRALARAVEGQRAQAQ